MLIESIKIFSLIFAVLARQLVSSVTTGSNGSVNLFEETLNDNDATISEIKTFDFINWDRMMEDINGSNLTLINRGSSLNANHAHDTGYQLITPSPSHVNRPKPVNPSLPFPSFNKSTQLQDDPNNSRPSSATPGPTPITPNPVLRPFSILHPLRNLVLMSFEGWRTLIQNTQRIEEFLRNRINLPSAIMPIRRLDPLHLKAPVVFDYRDQKLPVLGKLIFTLENVMITGLSSFRVEKLHMEPITRMLNFQHIIPRLDSLANYTIDYHLFDAIPFRVSQGSLQATIPNAHIKGSFQMFPDIINAWFRMGQFNMSTWVDEREDMDLHLFPNYIINDRFVIERSIRQKIDHAIRTLLPGLTDLLKITYSKAIELRIHN